MMSIKSSKTLNFILYFFAVLHLFILLILPIIGNGELNGFYYISIFFAIEVLILAMILIFSRHNGAATIVYVGSIILYASFAGYLMISNAVIGAENDRNTTESMRQLKEEYENQYPEEVGKKASVETTDMAIGLTIKIPEDWMMMDSQEMKLYGIAWAEDTDRLIIKKDSDYEKCKDAGCGPSIDANGLTISRIKDDYQSDINKYLNQNDYQDTDVTDTKIAGEEASIVVSRCDGIGCNIPSWYIFKNGYLYIFRTGITAYPEFETMIESVKFED